MERRNRCHEAGCPDLCCSGMWVIANMTESRKVFPNMTQVGGWTEVDKMPNGVAMVGEETGGEVMLYIKNCPNHVQSGCNGTRLKNCTAFEFGGGECNKIRRSHGLYQIDEQGNQIRARQTIFSRLIG